MKRDIFLNFVTWRPFQICCSLLGMLGIFGEVGRPNSMKPLPGSKFWSPKFSRTNFFRSLLILFLRPKFSRPIPRLFFETKYFWDRYRDFILRLNIFGTDTETFFETKIFETETDTLKKLRKVSIPRSLETRCHTLLSVPWSQLTINSSMTTMTTKTAMTAVTTETAIYI